MLWNALHSLNLKTFIPRAKNQRQRSFFVRSREVYLEKMKMKGVTFVSSEKFDTRGNEALGGAGRRKRVLLSAAAVLREEHRGFLCWRIFPESPHRGKDPFWGLFGASYPLQQWLNLAKMTFFRRFWPIWTRKIGGAPWISRWETKRPASKANALIRGRPEFGFSEEMARIGKLWWGTGLRRPVQKHSPKTGFTSQHFGNPKIVGFSGGRFRMNYTVYGKFFQTIWKK